jgi:hypothetical protein
MKIIGKHSNTTSEQDAEFLNNITATIYIHFNTNLLHNTYTYWLLLLHVSTINVGHLQGATTFFDVHSVYGILLYVKWQTIYISVNRKLNYNVKILLLIYKYMHY